MARKPQTRPRRPAPASPSAASSAARRAPSAPRTTDASVSVGTLDAQLQAQYGHIGRDLRRIIVIAIAMLGLIIASRFVLLG